MTVVVVEVPEWQWVLQFVLQSVFTVASTASVAMLLCARFYGKSVQNIILANECCLALFNFNYLAEPLYLRLYAVRLSPYRPLCVGSCLGCAKVLLEWTQRW